MTVKQNFSGCIENLYFNELHMFRDLMKQDKADVTGFYTGSVARYKLYGASTYQCLMTDVGVEAPITFLSDDNFLQYDGSEATTMRVTLQFRTFQPLGVLFWAQLSGGGGI